MPLYEYECEACGVRFEQIQKFSDPHVEVCPSCGGVVHKLTSLPSIRFKGSGWYVTDYAGKGQTVEKGPAVEKSQTADTGTKTSESTEREKSSPSGNTSSSSPSTPSTGSSSSDS